MEKSPQQGPLVKQENRAFISPSKQGKFSKEADFLTESEDYTWTRTVSIVKNTENLQAEADCDRDDKIKEYQST